MKSLNAPDRPYSSVPVDPEKLLQASFGSIFPEPALNHRVWVRYIELDEALDTAVLSVQAQNVDDGSTQFYTAQVTRQQAIDWSGPLDIVIVDGSYHHIEQKLVTNNPKATALKTLPCPTDALVLGEKHQAALYAPKGTVIMLPSTWETVHHRTLYHLADGTRKFIVNLGGDRHLEYPVDTSAGPLGVPGDFMAFEGSGYVSLIVGRLSERELIRDDSKPLMLLGLGKGQWLREPDRWSLIGGGTH
ncbi:hypothetical protein [Pseudomonas sp. UBA2522]|uniref:hypothetical protein n=1 Tax=Pseudomonas sp. UBA2522 TaxID=1947309 RepID=UPI00257D77F1|nr:hypothetical protein [Pseudomonas sp. UBA2522]